MMRALLRMILFSLFVLLTSLVLVVIRMVQAAHARECLRGQMTRVSEASSQALDHARAALVLILGCELTIERMSDLTVIPTRWPPTPPHLDDDPR